MHVNEVVKDIDIFLLITWLLLTSYIHHKPWQLFIERYIVYLFYYFYYYTWKFVVCLLRLLTYDYLLICWYKELIGCEGCTRNRVEKVTEDYFVNWKSL